MMKQVRQLGYVCTFGNNLVPVSCKADCVIRIGGFDKPRQSQPYWAYRRDAHPRDVSGSVETMGFVHCFCCVPGIHPPDYVLTAHENLGKKTDNICAGTYVQKKASRTGTREIVFPTPVEKEYQSAATRPRVHRSHRGLDQCVRPGFPCPST